MRDFRQLGSTGRSTCSTPRRCLTPLGFHASVRSPDGAWYIDRSLLPPRPEPVRQLLRPRLEENPHGTFVERGPFGETDPLALGAAAQEQPTVTLRTYRLALLTDPTYATFFGGPQNVTAAKVVLMNRVNQIYEDETAIRLVLIADRAMLSRRLETIKRRSRRLLPEDGYRFRVARGQTSLGG